MGVFRRVFKHCYFHKLKVKVSYDNEYRIEAERKQVTSKTCSQAMTQNPKTNRCSIQSKSGSRTVPHIPLFPPSPFHVCKLECIKFLIDYTLHIFIPDRLIKCTRHQGQFI